MRWSCKCGGLALTVARREQAQEDMEAVADVEERERLVYGVRNNSFDRELGQYPEEANQSWTRLSYLITPATL